LLLLICAGLFVRTLENLQRQDLGFNRQNLLLFHLDPTQDGYKGTLILHLYNELLQRLGAVTGVRSATLSRATLVAGWVSTGAISVENYKPKQGQEMGSIWWNTVGPGFFETMGIPLLLGRGIESRDTPNSPWVAVVNRALAQQFFGDVSPLGYRFNFGEAPNPNEAYSIVGVVGNAKYGRVREEAPPTVYIPYAQLPTSDTPGAMNFEIRTTGNPLKLVGTMVRVIHDFDRNLTPSDVQTQVQEIDESLVQERLFAKLTSFFSVLALSLACLGLYGTLAYAATRRTNEIGIRMALGGERRAILTMLMQETLAMAVAGVAVGIAMALAATRLVSNMLFGLKPTDLLTLVLATAVMLAAAAFAGYLPARRASQVDPMVALRYE
jgi:predicted permease